MESKKKTNKFLSSFFIINSILSMMFQSNKIKWNNLISAEREKKINEERIDQTAIESNSKQKEKEAQKLFHYKSDGQNVSKTQLVCVCFFYCFRRK